MIYLKEILNTKILLFPMLSREDKLLHINLFSELKDSSDIPHAICAYILGCSSIIAYDDHFKECSEIIEYKSPEEIIKNIKSSDKQKEKK